MAIKKSVRLVDETVNLCNAVSHDGEENWSGGINKIAERYGIFVEKCLPELSQFEKLAICQSYNGHAPHGDLRTELRMMDWHLSESVTHDGSVAEMIDKSEAGRDEFLAKAKAWTLPERLAVFHMAYAFWNDRETT